MIRVGIVDDHQLFIDGLRSIFSQDIGIEITVEANDGFSYLDKTKEDSVDLTISDIRMPEMNGFILTRELISRDPEHKVLILSMCDQPSDIKDIIKARANGYLPKNVGQEELTQAIIKIVKGGLVYPEEYLSYIQEKTVFNNHQHQLTQRETDVLRLIARGRTSQEIAEELGLSKHTVDTHRKNIHRKLDLDGSAALMKYAIEHYIL